jgi:hypothetical protein
MKTIRRFAQVQVLLLSLLSATVVPMTTHADEVRGAFTLTTATHWGPVVLPPGDYTFSLATNNAMPVIFLRSNSGAVSAFIPASSETGTKDKSPNALKIETIGRTSVITELHFNDAGLVLYYAAPASAVETASKSTDSKTTLVGTK